MNRIKRISMQLIGKHSDLFGDDYDKNKEVLDKVAVFRSKQLRNEVAGYITAYMRGQMDSEEEEQGEEAEGAEEIAESVTK